MALLEQKAPGGGGMRKQQRFYKEVERFKTILSKRTSDYLRFLQQRSGSATSKEVAAAARELLRERNEPEANSN